MNKGNGFGRKLRHGSASLGITALVIAAVVLFNVLVSALCVGNRWFIEVTGEVAAGRDYYLYRLNDTAKNLLTSTMDSINENRAEDDPVQVDIIFCADPDILYKSSKMRSVYYTALEFQKHCPESISVSTVDVWDNPSAVDAYRNNTYSNIYQSNVIIASGSEFRIFTLDSFFITDSTTEDPEPWAYNGVKKILSGIIAVTHSEAPICALTCNHGEPFDPKTGETEYTEFIKVIEGAGYDVVYLDLEKEEIPENCRLIITFDPQRDFASPYVNDAEVSEIDKLEKFIDKAYSYMVFFDADTPELPVLEEYLEEWGISIDRYSGLDESGESIEGTLELADKGNAIDSAGSKIVGQYCPEGLGAGLTTDLRESGGSPKVIFGNAVPILYNASAYQLQYSMADEDGNEAFTYATFNKYSDSRSIFEVFGTGDTAYAYAKAAGERLTDQDGNDIIADTYDSQNPYHLMTITVKNRTLSEGQGFTSVNDASYVCAVGSTDFASNEILSKNSYGNADTLLATLRNIGREVVPVGLDFVTLYDATVGTDYYDASAASAYTVVLVLLPVLAMTIAGVYVLVRRKTRH